MSVQGARLSDSAFLAGVDQRDRSWWRFAATLGGGLLAGLIAGLVVGGLALAAFAFAVTPSGGAIGALPSRIAGLITANGATLTSTLMLMMLAATTNGPLAAVFILIAALVGRRRILDYLTAAPAFRWRQLAIGLLFSVVVIGPMVAVSQWLDPHAQRPPILTLASDAPSRLGYVIASIVLLIPAAAAEEAVFRGWMLRQMSVLTQNPWALMALNGLLFSAIHMDFAPDAFLTRALMGAGFVYMTLRLGGVEFSTGAHAANNIMIVLFIQPLSATVAPSTGFSPGSAFQDLFLFGAYVAMAEITARWGPLRRWSGADLALRRPAASVAAGPWS